MIFALHPFLGMFALAGSIILILMAVLNEWIVKPPLSQSNEAASRNYTFTEMSLRNTEGALVHLTAYKQRIIPIIHGDVIQVSADRLTDPKTNAPYYTAFVRIDQGELADMPNIRLYPGMPATVMIPTVQRTAFEYIVGPLAMSFNQSLRQK